jgi:DNA polymerase I-like protein with 3'-5' exonuclease and polymerase domains
LADYNGHELRILAHYVGGKIRDEYKRNPALDMHDFMQQKMSSVLRKPITRKDAKTTGFAVLYGSGISALCEGLGGVDERSGYDIKDAYIRNFPGLDRLIAWTKNFEGTSKRMETWGGRSYQCQPSEGGRSFSYKMLNTLIQSSAADMIKAAMLEFDTLKHPETELIMSLHDEVGIHAPDQILDDQLALLSDVMKRQNLTVPLLVDQEVGRSWGHAMEDA